MATASLRGTRGASRGPMRLLSQRREARTRNNFRATHYSVFGLLLAALVAAGCAPLYLPVSDGTLPQVTMAVDSPSVSTTVGSAPVQLYFPASGIIEFRADATDVDGGVSKVWLQGGYSLACLEGNLVHATSGAIGDQFVSPISNAKPGDAVFPQLAAYVDLYVSEFIKDCANSGWSFGSITGDITAYGTNYYGGTAHSGELSFTVG
jgi:hypothetical protein